jgi:hypothetical protein
MLAHLARVLVVVGAVAATLGSASSNQSTSESLYPPAYGQAQPGAGAAPPAQHMQPGRALGTWRSTFGAVKIEGDSSRGGIERGAVQGVWLYTRQGAEVVGYFSGTLKGNVMQFKWQEPGSPPLVGEGYLVFDPQGRQYSGRWWSDRRDRIGDWNGWRSSATERPARVDPGTDPDPNPYRHDEDRDDDDDEDERDDRRPARPPQPQPQPVTPTYY